MAGHVLTGILTPFIGTAVGAAFVFFMRGQLNRHVQCALSGFAAGVMTAASVWSLLIPAIDQSAQMGALAFIPAAAGFWIGVGFLLLMDNILPRLRVFTRRSEPGDGHHETNMMLLAVTLHNIPEGMAVGVVYAGLLAGAGDVSAAGAFALALGIAIQNIPEGAIISMPLHAQGKNKRYAFVMGVLSGAVEPVGALLTLLLSGLLTPLMPYLLSFAAGAMFYVVVDELIPEASADGRDALGVISFAAGFCAMMIPDVALG